MSNALQALAASQKSLSLRDRASSIREAGKSNILLLDTSSSMDTPTDGGWNPEALRRIDVLWNVVQRLRGDGISFRVCEFNNYAVWSDSVTRPVPQGGTEIADAFAFIASAMPKTVTVITDGEPAWNSEDLAIANASALRCKINVVFVGDSTNERAIAFCKKLAEAGGGRYAHNDLSSESLQIEATATVRLMIAAPASQKETIQL